jgi:hypothetical protein
VDKRGEKRGERSEEIYVCIRHNGLLSSFGCISVSIRRHGLSENPIYMFGIKVRGAYTSQRAPKRELSLSG